LLGLETRTRVPYYSQSLLPGFSLELRPYFVNCTLN
jgi:hypothetical protein